MLLRPVCQRRENGPGHGLWITAARGCVSGVDIFVDNSCVFVEKWKTYGQSLCFIPSTDRRKESFVDSSRVMVSTPCMMVV